MLADFLTIKENFDEIRGLNFVFMGDARNNVARSLMIMCAKMGVNFTCVAPSSLFPDNELVETAKRIASLENSTITLTEDVNSGTKNANIQIQRRLKNCADMMAKTDMEMQKIYLELNQNRSN